jgi:hypothetical protein
MGSYFDRMTLYRFTLCVIKTEKQVVIFGASVAVLPFSSSLFPRQTNATTFQNYESAISKLHPRNMVNIRTTVRSQVSYFFTLISNQKTSLHRFL